ncbi:MAG TPA: flavodoxin domain-containing protein [Dehalococcoidia bacterium]|nr:flavodoxin domain-containing protein [Dehalococcoidia bacterium]
MKALIVYDSVYGNTEKIARAIAEAIAPSNEIKVLRASEANPSELSSINLLIVGSPTHGGRPTPAIQDFLNKVPQLSLQGINVAAFDTRIPTKLVGVFGYAAGRIAGNLKKKGGTLIASPQGFFVIGSKGPLKEGEPERAVTWAKGILQSKK